MSVKSDLNRCVPRDNKAIKILQRLEVIFFHFGSNFQPEFCSILNLSRSRVNFHVTPSNILFIQIELLEKVHSREMGVLH